MLEIHIEAAADRAVEAMNFRWQADHLLCSINALYYLATAE